jgi:hypothetical protein
VTTGDVTGPCDVDIVVLTIEDEPVIVMLVVCSSEVVITGTVDIGIETDMFTVDVGVAMVTFAVEIRELVINDDIRSGDVIVV